jgi:hypothetical protein
MIDCIEGNLLATLIFINEEVWKSSSSIGWLRRWKKL